MLEKVNKFTNMCHKINNNNNKNNNKNNKKLYYKNTNETNYNNTLNITASYSPTTITNTNTTSISNTTYNNSIININTKNTKTTRITTNSSNNNNNNNNKKITTSTGNVSTQKLKSKINFINKSSYNKKEKKYNNESFEVTKSITAKTTTAIRKKTTKTTTNFLEKCTKYSYIFIFNFMSMWYILTFNVALTHAWINGIILPDENGPLSEAQTAVGLEVSMPCDLTPGNTIPDTTDKVTLVIWYKEGLIKPIYSFDARGKPYQDASHWQDPQVLKQKARFYYDSNPPALRIRDVQREDAGLYRCRVDFHRSPTRNWRINVTVLVPPKTLTILDTHGAAVTENIVGPYDEGSNINLTCISSGGIPSPRVSWWKEHALLDDGYQVLPDGSVRNILHLSNISRKDLMTIYTCQATNGHVVAPLSNAVKLDMNLPPLYVRLQGLNHALSAGVRTQITCTSAGARPPPQIVWSKGGIIMRGATQSTSQDGNVTISELVFIPVPEDNEKQIICSVTSDFQNQWQSGGIEKINHLDNNIAAGIFLKDSRTLDVKHAPIVSLNLGAPLDPSNLMKGSDVYLECDIKSNPPVKKVDWYHNDKQLQSSRGIIISNQTLVLQGISKVTHGQYFCRASNVQGTVSSNEVYLDVKYPPVCKTESTIIRAALKQIVNITCDVDSNPQNNLSYKWNFNNSLESIIELPPILRYSNRILSSSDNINDIGLPDSDDMLDDDSTTYLDEKQMIEQQQGPRSQMVYSNLAHQQQIEKIRKQQQQHNFQIYQNQQRSKSYQMNHNYHNSGSSNNDQHKYNKIQDNSFQLNNLYRYRVESFTHFGTVSCIASNSVGQSQPCLYHITPAELPDPVKNCTAFNSTANSIHLVCVPGNDGGIQQHFHVEVYDELNRQILYNTSYKYSEFTIKRLPSDSVFVIRVMAYNLQGFSNRAYRLRAKTLSAPLLRTASSTAVLVQLTPLLGALVGVVITLILVSTCVVLIIKFRTKNHNRRPRNHSRNDTQTTEADKGSAEPLSRNMGSHSSLEDKNPDVIPQENSEDEYHLEEKVFNRMDFDSKRNLYTTPRLNSTSPTPLSPTFAKQYGELSLTTNPSYALYNSPQRLPATQRPVYTDPPELSSPRSQCNNIYTKVPSKTSFLQNTQYDTRLTSPTSPFEQTIITSNNTTTTIPCTYSSLNRQQTKPSSITNYKSLALNVPQSAATLSKNYKNGTGNLSNLLNTNGTGTLGISTGTLKSGGIGNISGGNGVNSGIGGGGNIVTTPVSTATSATVLKSPYQMSTTTTLLIDNTDSILGNYEENS